MSYLNLVRIFIAETNLGINNSLPQNYLCDSSTQSAAVRYCVMFKLCKYDNVKIDLFHEHMGGAHAAVLW